MTNTAGEFRFVALQPATYGLQATLDGFQTYKRDIAVSLGRTVKNDFTMTLGAVTDVIEVTGEAPMVDVTSTVAGLTVSTDEINNRLPIGREASQIAMLAPASVSSDSAFTGNSSAATKIYTPGQQVVSISGNSVAENSYQVNGLNLTNFRNGLGSSFVPFEFMEEVQVKTGGYEAEFGRATGGVINMVTKSGSNSFRGGVNAYYQPSSLQEMKDNNYLYPNEAGESEELEANASLGGPIFKDKLFYFALRRLHRPQRLVDDDDARHPQRAGNPVLRRQARLEHHPQLPPRGDLLHRRDHRRHHGPELRRSDRHLRRRDRHRHG